MMSDSCLLSCCYLCCCVFFTLFSSGRSNVTDVSVGVLVFPEVDWSPGGQQFTYDDVIRTTRINISLTLYNIQTSTDLYLTAFGATGSCAHRHLLLLSLDDCTNNFAQTFHHFPLPVIRVNHDITCDFTPESHSIINYPSVVSVDHILDEVLDSLGWHTVNVFYCSQDTLYQEVVLALQRHQAKTRDRFIHDATNLRDDIESLTPHYTADDSVNSIIICPETVVIEILDQTQEMLEAENNHLPFVWRWLALARSKRSVETIEQALDARVAHLAVLLIEEERNTTLEQRIEEVLDHVGYSLMSSSMEPVLLGSNQCNQSDVTSRAQTETWLAYLQTRLTAASQNRTWNEYTLYRIEWDITNVRYSLSSEVLCEGGKCHDIPDIFVNEKYGLNNRTLLVATELYPAMVVFDTVNNTDVFSGVCIELLKQLAVKHNFSYEIMFPDDREYGKQLPDGTWTGLVGMVERKEVDLAVAPLWVTESRKKVLAFTRPYHNQAHTGIFKQPSPDERKWRVVIEPLRWHVWVSVMFAVLFTGWVAWAISKVSARLLKNTEAAIEDTFVSLQKSVWYVFGAMLTQGGVYEPVSRPCRCIIGLWWAFVIILVATYGGNLIAFLSITKLVVPFETLDELLHQSRYRFGFMGLGGTAAMEVIEASSDVRLQEFARRVKGYYRDDKDVLSPHFDVHMAKVRNGDYTFVSDVMSLRNERAANCDLTLMKEVLLSSPYAIAMPKDSPYKLTFDDSITRFLESGMIKFWLQKYSPGYDLCSNLRVPQARVVSLMDTQSLFYVLVVGITISLITLLVEFVRAHLKKRKLGKVEPESTCKNEMKRYDGDTTKQASSNFGEAIGEGEAVKDLPPVCS